MKKHVRELKWKGVHMICDMIQMDGQRGTVNVRENPVIMILYGSHDKVNSYGHEIG